jgi:NADPH:quinone reductase-like Zn-dependent oxidoreductase
MSTSPRIATMRAIVQDTYGPADVLERRDVPPPEIGDEDVLVRVRAAGVDASVWHLMTGLPYLVRLAYGLRAPKSSVPGSDLAGIVEAVGANVTDFRSGDEVFGTGTGSFAEYARVRSDRLARKPAALSFEAAAAIPISATTALLALRRAEVQAGQHVLVVGAGGGVGTFAVQLARVLGAEVTGVCSTGKVELVGSLGADRVIDYTCADPFDGSNRYDVILDIAGNRPLATLRRALEPRGTLVIIGGEEGGRWLGGTERLLRAAMLSPLVGQRLVGLMATTRGDDLRHLAELAEAGHLTPVLDRTFPLDAATEAVRYAQEGRACGKVVLTI